MGFLTLNYFIEKAHIPTIDINMICWRGDANINYFNHSHWKLISFQHATNKLFVDQSSYTYLVLAEFYESQKVYLEWKHVDSRLLI